MRPPTVSLPYEAMPSEPSERHETAVELFGQHLFSLRNQRLAGLRCVVESADVRGRLATLHRREYDSIAALPPVEREAALDLARKAIDQFLQDILGLLTNTGNSVKFGPQHAITYELVLQVKQTATGEILETFPVNRGGHKSLASYFGRWLNRYGNHT